MENVPWNYMLIAEGTLHALSVYHKGLSESMPVQDRWFFQNLSDAMGQLLSFERDALDLSPEAHRNNRDKSYHAIRIVAGQSGETVVKVESLNAQESAAAGLRQGVYANICMDLPLFAATCGIDLEQQGLLYPGTSVVPLAYLRNDVAGALTTTGEKTELLQQLQHITLPFEARWKYRHQLVEHQMAIPVAAKPDLVINSYYHYFDIAMPLRAVLLTEPNLMEKTAVSALLADVRMIQTSTVVDDRMRPQFSIQCAFEKTHDKDRKLLGIYLKFERDVRAVEKEAHIDLSDITTHAVGSAIPLYQYQKDLRIFYSSTGMQFLKMHLQDELQPAAVDRLRQRYLIELEWAGHNDPPTADIRIGNDQRRQVEDQAQAVKLLLSVQDELFSSEVMDKAGKQSYLRQATLFDTIDDTVVVSKYLTCSGDPRLDGYMVVEVRPEKLTTEAFEQLRQYGRAQTRTMVLSAPPRVPKNKDKRGPKL